MAPALAVATAAELVHVGHLPIENAWLGMVTATVGGAV